MTILFLSRVAAASALVCLAVTVTTGQAAAFGNFRGPQIAAIVGHAPSGAERRTRVLRQLPRLTPDRIVLPATRRAITIGGIRFVRGPSVWLAVGGADDPVFDAVRTPFSDRDETSFTPAWPGLNLRFPDFDTPAGSTLYE